MHPISWLDITEYPFRHNFFRTPHGSIHYIDEGEGEPVIFIHGNPSWSFLFRNVIKGLSGTSRCIAPDHLGFGLSDKPVDWSYLPEDHAANLELFLESLDLKDMTLVVGDWGGPIGLSYAIRHPRRVRNIVITNTWLWPVRDDWYYQAFSRFIGGPIGRWLIYRYNFFARTLMPRMFGTRSRLTPEIHRHYLAPLARPEERKGCWVFPGRIIGSSDWLQSLWEQRDVLGDKQILIAWGMKDIGFRKKELATWIRAFPRARVVRYEDCGHFVAEERPADLTTEIRNLLGASLTGNSFSPQKEEIVSGQDNNL
jgi:haloalkane dehalogenase